MPASETPAIAVSAPGKVLLAGGYLVTDREYTGLVFGLDARINVVARGIPTGPGVQLSEVVVESPQFIGATWRYGYHLAPDDGGITVTQLQVGSSTISPNPFIETTLTYALTYISRTLNSRQPRPASFQPARLTILADASYYSAPTDCPIPSPPNSRFPHLQTTLSAAKKTGLGSSAALVTALTAALLTHYLSTPASSLHLPTLHNLAQTAHCRAQGKIGSGFDVAAAVHGSCLYRRFPPTLLDRVPAPGTPHFGAQLEALVNDDDSCWGVQPQQQSVVALPAGIAVRMCDVDCGSQTVGMVKAVNAWRAREPQGARALWDELQARNERLAAVLAAGRTDELREAIRASRELVRKMGELSGVPIEPEEQTALLDALEGVEGVFGGVVPGAGGYDAVAVLVRDDDETVQRLERFLGEWGAKKEDGGKVRLLSVKGELEGVRTEDLAQFEGWL